MRDQPDLFAALKRSDFRRRFKLGIRERQYMDAKGLDAVIVHARKFIKDRLAPANAQKDGSQTPMRGHPVFIAQHATATCCRSCLQKWHGIAKGKSLSETEVEYLLRVLKCWLEQQHPSAGEGRGDGDEVQRHLFE
jgi:hypothetical protein